MTKPLAVIIPVRHNSHLTRALLKDIFLEDDLVDVFIVDNAGDYTRIASETVISSKENLGWLRGSNLGLSFASKLDYRVRMHTVHLQNSFL